MPKKSKITSCDVRYFFDDQGVIYRFDDGAPCNIYAKINPNLSDMTCVNNMFQHALYFGYGNSTFVGRVALINVQFLKDK